MLPDRVDNLEIIHWPDPRLKLVGRKVEVFDQRLQALAQRMIELMYQANGLGLAATQVGVDAQLFVGRSPEQPDKPQIYVNAELFNLGGTVSSEEGCLSVPGITLKLKRSARMGVRAQDLDGKHFEHEADKLLSRMWQHEADHCNGVVIIDRMSRLQHIAHRQALRELEEHFKQEQ